MHHDRGHFFAKLQAYVTCLGTDRPCYTGGDFNADIHNASARGRRLTAVSQFENFLASTDFAVSSRVLRTTKSRQLDYIAVRHKFVSGYGKCKVQDSPIATDHRMLFADIRVRWRKEKKLSTIQDPKPFYDGLAYDEGSRASFNEHTSLNCFTHLMTCLTHSFHNCHKSVHLCRLRLLKWLNSSVHCRQLQTIEVVVQMESQLK